MAASDYHLCAVCGGKAFYDANIEDSRYIASYDPTIKNSWDNSPVEPIGIAVLCSDCNKTHEVFVRLRAVTEKTDG
jgi:hypothetical protein